MIFAGFGSVNVQQTEEQERAATISQQKQQSAQYCKHCGAAQFGDGGDVLMRGGSRSGPYKTRHLQRYM